MDEVAGPAPIGPPPDAFTQDPVAPPEILPEATTPSGRRYLFDVLLGLDLAALALILVTNVVVGLYLLVEPAGPQATAFRANLSNTSTSLFLANVALTFLLTGLIPTLWVFGTRAKPLRGFVRYLGLSKPSGLAVGLGVGALALAATYVAGILFVAAESALHHESVQAAVAQNRSPLEESIVALLTPALALVLAAVAAWGEEVLFRGVLQPWLGVWGQAILFGLFHAGYGTILQFLVPLGLGVAFGFIYRRTGNLWITIGAHFTFDAVQLSLALATR
ncbi:MAG: CPBP family intramembrane glutamic endopeptidase [Thermoplasmatota archaeon]